MVLYEVWNEFEGSLVILIAVNELQNDISFVIHVNLIDWIHWIL